MHPSQLEIVQFLQYLIQTGPALSSITHPLHTFIQPDPLFPLKIHPLQVPIRPLPIKLHPLHVPVVPIPLKMHPLQTPLN